ncbi:hypothetical protein D9M68_956840 [compost metagenome]
MEHVGQAGRGPREPVHRVLEDAGHAVVVFGGDEQQAVAGEDALLQRPHGRWRALALFQIAVVERNAMQRGRIELSHAARQRLGGMQQRRVEGLRPQAAGNAEELDHGGVPCRFRFSRNRASRTRA